MQLKHRQDASCDTNERYSASARAKKALQFCPWRREAKKSQIIS
ncbi:hypothetical protein SM11_pC0289 (plasmid) [Sinorhizobium meliloti SM11]|uniref:Uncharacterized protein n=1 Tax=Sinorhizobium meliloti (strain SM11) TaxID=707241 RepID=F7XC71_SINMM|nr:hypothetical protein SM11_pC0289 [Sinorhizobium meliloti SM11]GEC42354.1 hypothetical protein EME01_64260 [Sinorhizobium meliloti]